MDKHKLDDKRRKYWTHVKILVNWTPYLQPEGLLFSLKSRTWEANQNLDMKNKYAITYKRLLSCILPYVLTFVAHFCVFFASFKSCSSNQIKSDQTHDPKMPQLQNWGGDFVVFFLGTKIATSWKLRGKNC